MKELVSKTKIFDNESCPKHAKKEHAIAKGMHGILNVVEGALEFVWEDTQEKIIVDPTKPFKIDSQRKHHLNLIWEVKFFIEFYKD